MKAKKKLSRNSDAVEILHRRYIGGDKERNASLQEERINAEIARMIYGLRRDAGLTQKELAARVGTTQSVISRLEDAEYEGHSLSMLNRIASSLDRRLAVTITSDKAREGGRPRRKPKGALGKVAGAKSEGQDRS